MATATLPSRPSRSATETPPAKKFSLVDIKSEGDDLPNRYIVHALEGWGKTSLAAQMPSPVFLQSKGETGLETLISAGRLPKVPHFPECGTWGELMSGIDLLRSEEHPYRTLAIDTINGAERLCHEHVCARDFSGDWTDKGFLGYMRGYEVSLADWRMLLNSLDQLRATKRMNIVLLCHTKVKPFRNPEGPDYDRYSPDMHDKTWSLTHKWADVVLFGNFDVTLTAVTENRRTGVSKGKGTGGNIRLLHTERHAAYDAKNRLGLPDEIEMGNSAAEAWANYIAAVKSARGTVNA